MKKFAIYAFLSAFFLFPMVSSGAVVISEIAWMGTETSTSDEWIELFNDGAESVSLSGFSIEAGDGSPIIALSGTISAQSYFLLERTDDSTVPAVSANIIYTGALANEGEMLTLKSGGEVVQTINASSGWPAGDNTMKETMQWTGSAWITGTPTPKAANVSTPASSGTTPASSSSENTSTSEGGNDSSAHYSPAPISENNHVSTVGVSAGRNRVTTTKSPVFFEAELAGMSAGSSVGNENYKWSLGDGSVKTGKVITHSYDYPGSYIVIINVALPEGKEAVDRLTVTVVDPNVSIAHVGGESGKSYVELANKGSTDINLYNWKLANGANSSFVFPKDMILAKNSSVKVSESVSRVALEKSITLFDPSGTSISHFILGEERTAGVEADIRERPASISSVFPRSAENESREASLSGNVAEVSVVRASSPSGTEADVSDSKIVIYEAEEEIGWFARILVIPTKIFRALRGFLF